MTRIGLYSSWTRCCGRSGRQSMNISVVLAPRGEVAGSDRVGTGFTRPREGRRTVRVPLSGLLEKAAGAAAQLKKHKYPTREAKATKDGRGKAGGRGLSGSRAPSGSSRPAVSSGGIVRPGAGTQGPVGRTRWQQQQLQPPAFNTRSRNDTRQTGARAVQVAPVPAEESASYTPACDPGTKAASAWALVLGT